jgi:hypothetical protein
MKCAIASKKVIRPDNWSEIWNLRSADAATPNCAALHPGYNSLHGHLANQRPLRRTHHVGRIERRANARCAADMVSAAAARRLPNANGRMSRRSALGSPRRGYLGDRVAEVRHSRSTTVSVNSTRHGGQTYPEQEC